MNAGRKMVFISTVAIPLLALHGLGPLLEVETVTAGAYLDSAHGDVVNGVCRAGSVLTPVLQETTHGETAATVMRRTPPLTAVSLSRSMALLPLSACSQQILILGL
ncbi:MAG: hypothetical protein C0613_15070 [Desulfobulbaceae bacterium]|nr:MAG: hypothetical protein C0613_15070 [Desulfobulbaceae bacterium]